MKKQTLTALLSILLTLVLSSCQEDLVESAKAESKAPTRAAAVLLLQHFAENLEAGTLVEAGRDLMTPPSLGAEEKAKALISFLERDEISSAGVSTLAEKGTWQKLTVAIPDRADHLAERMAANAEDCWFLGYEGAEAVFSWDGSRFQLMRCDDIGKLK